jgi:hypothetical protein
VEDKLLPQLLLLRATFNQMLQMAINQLQLVQLTTAAKRQNCVAPVVIQNSHSSLLLEDPLLHTK